RILRTGSQISADIRRLGPSPPSRRGAEGVAAQDQRSTRDHETAASGVRERRDAAAMKAPSLANQAALLAQNTEDAWSFAHYASWHAVALALLKRGYSSTNAEMILRSKLTRWAAVQSTPKNKATANDLLRYIDAHPEDVARVLEGR